MKRYESYSVSGLTWLGDIPSHWKLLRGKRLFKQRNRPVRDCDEVVTAFRDGTVTLRSNRRIEGFTNSMLEIGYQGIRKGDLVIHAMDAFAGAIGVSDSDGKATPVYAVCTPLVDINVYYFSLLLRYMAHSGYILSLAKGIRERSTDFRFAEFAMLNLPVPPREEQDTIVAYLDQKLAEIDRFVANKEQLIELLKEQKAVIINRAVTRGVDPDVPMKQSGIDELGEIPIHWNVGRAKYVFHEVNERSETGLETHLSMSQRLGLVETKSIEEKTLQSETQEGFKLCRIDDLVLNRLKAHLGVFARATIPGLVSPDYTVFRLSVKANVQYFELLYKHPAYVAAFNRKVRGIVVGFLRLYTPDFYDILTLFPPPEEQDRIISFIHSESMEIDRIISRATREIELIKEFRTTLISDVVTGKIDVRTAVKEEIPV